MSITVALVVAASNNHVIGKEGNLPWRLSTDLKHFKKLTSGHPVIMGRKTWDSIGKALPKRKNIVITRNRQFAAKGALLARSLYEAIALADLSEHRRCFVIGGAEIYQQSLGIADEIYLTRVETEIKGDAFFPELDKSDWALVD